MTRAVVRTVGELLLTAGVVLLLFAGYELYGTGLATGRAQHALQGELHRAWDGEPASSSLTAALSPSAAASPRAGVPAPRDGRPLAVLRIPRFGTGWTPRVIVEGVSPADLRVGPGHYPQTALPGQVGNFAVAGHRASHGNGFRRLDELRPGDALVVETGQVWLTYRVTSSQVVEPSAVSVIAPVPGHPGRPATARMITLTTCDPWYSAARRLVVHGVLASTGSKSAGPPAALRG